MKTGVTVLPEYFQNESVNGVLSRLAASGVTMVATSPYVMEAASETTGTREPPIDAGAGKVRLLDRPLWGKRELFVRTEPAFAPHLPYFDGLPYQPARPGELTAKQGGVLREFFQQAERRNIEAWLQVQAAIPPGYRVQFGGPLPEDRPLLPNGRVPEKRLANNASLASANVLAYTSALLRDLVRAYPSMSGVRLDWPEYPPYFLDDVFLDFHPAVEKTASSLRMNFTSLQRAASALYAQVNGGLKNQHLERWLGKTGGFLAQPALADLLHCKATLVQRYVARLREVLPARYQLALGVFPPPFSFVSGMNYRMVSPYVSQLHVKMYTMHWPVIFGFYAEQLLAKNEGLSEELVVRFLSELLHIQDPPASRSLAAFRYPEPEEPHPVGAKAQAIKLQMAQKAAGRTPVLALAHGYGPVEDFAARLRAARAASPHGVWVNRYAYLRDEKLAALKS
jgi:hypothetical protein